MANNEMSISAFSRRSLLSPKALRLYDELGLLKPSRVDPESGYRYYGESQLEAARIISLLRKLDVPLAEIAEILANEPIEASTRLESWWNQVEEHMKARRELLQYIRGTVLGDPHVQQHSLQAYPVEVREVPALDYLYITGHITGPDLPRHISESMEVLLAQTGATIGPHMVVYQGLVDLDSDGPVDVCLPVTPDVDLRDFESLRHEAAHAQAFTRLVKRQVAFPHIHQVYHAVRRWIESEEYEISGPPREMYLGSFERAAQDDPICDIAFPIRPGRK